jgi:hypothetical protein
MFCHPTGPPTTGQIRLEILRHVAVPVTAPQLHGRRAAGLVAGAIRHRARTHIGPLSSSSRGTNAHVTSPQHLPIISP